MRQIFECLTSYLLQRILYLFIHFLQPIADLLSELIVGLKDLILDNLHDLVPPQFILSQSLDIIGVYLEFLTLLIFFFFLR